MGEWQGEGCFHENIMPFQSNRRRWKFLTESLFLTAVLLLRSNSQPAVRACHMQPHPCAPRSAQVTEACSRASPGTPRGPCACKRPAPPSACPATSGHSSPQGGLRPVHQCHLATVSPQEAECCLCRPPGLYHKPPGRPEERKGAVPRCLCVQPHAGHQGTAEDKPGNPDGSVLQETGGMWSASHYRRMRSAGGASLGAGSLWGYRQSRAL